MALIFKIKIKKAKEYWKPKSYICLFVDILFLEILVKGGRFHVD